MIRVTSPYTKSLLDEKNFIREEIAVESPRKIASVFLDQYFFDVRQSLKIASFYAIKFFIPLRENHEDDRQTGKNVELIVLINIWININSSRDII